MSSQNSVNTKEVGCGPPRSVPRQRMNEFRQTSYQSYAAPSQTASRGGLAVVSAPAALAADCRPASQSDAWNSGNVAFGDMLRVLLVEDFAADAKLVSLALRETPDQTFVITHAATLRDALSILATTTIDVVLLDLSLPDSAGITTLTRLRDSIPQVPVVVMTGNSDPAFARRALEAGAQDYLVKGDDSGPVVARAIRYAIMRMAAQIDRESLIRKLESEQRALRRELDAARAMQFNLLPRPAGVDAKLVELGLTIEAYFEPSSGVGGDLWGMTDCGPGRIGFFSFDFSGHGLSAALNVFRLHTLMGEHVPNPEDPAASLAILNHSLNGLLAPGQYATIFFGILDTRRDELVWSAAGHPTPALMNNSGAIMLLDTRGTPLGATAHATYTNRRIAFPRGTSLFLYSDALTEATGLDGRMLGDETLLEMLRAGIANPGGLCLEDLLNQFLVRARLPIEDDLTALHVRRLA